MSEPNAPQLDYASPRPGHLSGGRLVFQVVLSCTLTCGLVMGGVFFAILFGAASGGSVPYVALPILVGALLLGAIVALGIRYQRQPLRRGLALGIWLGIGLA